MVAGDTAVAAVADRPAHLAECVPYGIAALFSAALYLKGRSRGAPFEICGKFEFFHIHLPFYNSSITCKFYFVFGLFRLHCCP